MSNQSATGQPLNFQWHQLDNGLAYMSVHVGSGNNFMVYTTPISCATYDEHRKILESKIKKTSP